MAAIMTFDPANYTCYNCGERGHLAQACPAKIPDEKTAHKMPSDDTIRQRILRIYQPATEAEMAGLVNTFKQHYIPGNEYAMAPRMPAGFLTVLKARASRPANQAADPSGWCADIREMLHLRTQASTGVRR